MTLTNPLFSQARARSWRVLKRACGMQRSAWLPARLQLCVRALLGGGDNVCPLPAALPRPPLRQRRLRTRRCPAHARRRCAAALCIVVSWGGLEQLGQTTHVI
ncbi:hypothetical protein R5R35_010502 [Gryllus longicercus]|uniref:Uncharacterized protein n=1 Tax=Gryllus longicercus TaxID=2509291 RepID=A0AAN9VKE0_9ORTH